MLTACLLLGLLELAPAPPNQDAPHQDAPTHRATGIVLDAQGRPLPGVPIVADVRIGVVAGSFEAELETDAAGRYEFAFTPSRAMFWIDLAIGGNGFSSVTRSVVPDAADPKPVIALPEAVLTRGSPLEIALIDEAGNPLSGPFTVELELGQGVNGTAERSVRPGHHRHDCVPRGTYAVRISREGEPAPCFTTRVEQDESGALQTLRVVLRRQLWVRVELPYPVGHEVPGYLLKELAVWVEPAEGDAIDAAFDPELLAYVFEDLPAGPLALRAQGPPQFLPFEATIEAGGRGLVMARLTGSLTLEVVLLEQGSAGRIADFDVKPPTAQATVAAVRGRASRRVEGLVPGVGQLVLSVPGLDRPEVIVDLAALTREEAESGRVVRTLPNWTSVWGELRDATGRPARDGVKVEILAIDERGQERPVGERLDLDRGGNYSFSRLVPGPHVVRAWWSPRHWQDFPVRVGEGPTERHVEREAPAVLAVEFEGTWPEALGLVVHHRAAPPGYPATTATLRPSSAGRFGPFELAPGEVDLGVARLGSGSSWPLERIDVAAGARPWKLDLARLPALVCWEVIVDGERLRSACRGRGKSFCATGEAKDPIPLGTRGARKDAMLFHAADSELTLTSDDGTWCAFVALDGLRPGELRDVKVELSRARRRVRVVLEGEPLVDHEIRVDVRTRSGILLQRTLRTDAHGEADLMFVTGVLTLFAVDSGRDPVTLDWSEDLGLETLEIELR